jgi:hypothetical protein
MKPKRSLIAILVFAVLLAGGVIIVVNANSDAFDSKMWQSQKGVERNNARTGMLGALERKHLRVGMPRKDVEALLGEPDIREPVRDIYELGVSPVGVDFESYVIEYDRANLVTGFRLSRG